MKKWISVLERLPSKSECEENSGWFIVFHKNGIRPRESRFDGYEKFYSYDHKWKYVWDIDITHWMPLPDCPAIENQ